MKDEAVGAEEQGTSAGRRAGFNRTRRHVRICAAVAGGLFSQIVLTAIARFPARLDVKGTAAEHGISLPEALHLICWRDTISGARYPSASYLRTRDLFALMPAAVLVPE